MMQLVNANNKTTKINKRENFNVYLLCLHWHNGYCGSFTRDQKATYEAAKQPTVPPEELETISGGQKPEN